jgi:predicted dehydrogenase
VRVGIVGAGWIAAEHVTTLRQLEELTEWTTWAEKVVTF